MASLFDIGKSGLQSYRQSLSVTGQNIANINTDGYKRRDASLEEVIGGQSGINSIGNSPGLGVRVGEIRRAFDEFLLNKARSATSYSQSTSTFATSVKQLEDIILPGEANLGMAIGRFFTGLQEVASNPADIASRTVALEQAKQMGETFAETSAQLARFMEGLTSQASQQLDDVNVLTNELASINRQLATASGTQPNNAMLDSRDAVIDRLTEYVEVTVDLNDKGVATVTLGDHGNGPRLVEVDTATRLGVAERNNKLEFVLSPGGSNIPTSQVTGGSLAGIKTAFATASDVMAEIDNLAFVMVRDVNAVHQRGLNMEGEKSGDLFRALDVRITPNPTNSGSASTELTVTDYSKVAADRITFSYDDNASIWNGRLDDGTLVASGRHQISLSGLQISFLGAPKGFDQFVLDPVAGSAAGVALTIQRPQDFAAASSTLVSADPGNRSDALISAERIAPAPAADLPSITDVFSNNRSAVAATSFLAGGAVAVIPANASNIDIFSLAGQSGARFSLSPESLGDAGTIALTVATTDEDNEVRNRIIDFNVNFADVRGFEGDWQDAGQIADLINVGSITGRDRESGEALSLAALGGYVSGRDGSLSFSLSKGEFSDASLQLTTAASIEGVVSPASETASDVQVFTREGRHVAGTAQSDVGAAAFQAMMTAENGFHDGATYVGDYLNMSGDRGYLGMQVDASYNGGILVQTEAASDETIVTFTALEGIDTNEASVDGRAASAATIDYSMSIGGLSATIDGADVGGPLSRDVASAMIAALRADAPIVTLTGVNASDVNEEDQMSFSFEGQSYILSMAGDEPQISGGEAGRLQAFFDADKMLHIVSNGGSISQSEIVIDAGVGDEANLAAAARFGLIENDLQVTTAFSSDDYTAPGFSLRLDGANIIVTPTGDAELPEVSADATSLAQQRYTLTNMPGEELIILVGGEGARRLSVQYDIAAGTQPEIARDIDVRVNDAVTGTLEFVDVETGTSLATRILDTDQYTAALGFGVSFTGALEEDDSFQISRNADGIGDNRNLNAILALQTKDALGVGSGGFQKIFNTTIARLGAVVQSGDIAADAASALRDASLEAESAYTGVNLDTEAAKLIEAQQAYQASARILSTARELFDTLIQSV